MRLRLRLLWLFIASFFKRPLDLTGESIINLMVLPNDVDITKITNDRYSALMDLGRLDLAFRIGLRGVLFKKGWAPVATFITIRFRYPLKVFQRYQLHTRILWWDDRTFYWEQTFKREGRVVATGHVCATVIKRGVVPTSEVVAAIDPGAVTPEMPQVVAKLREAERLIHASQQETPLSL